MNSIKKFLYKFQGQPNQNFLLNKNKIYELLEKIKLIFLKRRTFLRRSRALHKRVLRSFYSKL